MVAESWCIQNQLESSAGLRRMKQAHRHGKLRNYHAACLKSKPHVLEAASMLADQEADAANQRVTPIGVANDGRPVRCIGGEALRHAAKHAEVVLYSGVTPNQVEGMQMVRCTVGVRAEPIEDSAISTWRYSHIHKTMFIPVAPLGHKA